MRLSCRLQNVLLCCGIIALVGCGKAPIGTSTGTWTVYELAAGMENPATGIAGTVEVSEAGTGTLFKLAVTGLKGVSREFGAHVHAGPCEVPTQGAGHYQHSARPPDAGATDPTWANNDNEVWLDFTTDAKGAAAAERTSTFKVDATRAKAVVIHTMKTGAGGAAGTKLACIGLAFK